MPKEPTVKIAICQLVGRPDEFLCIYPEEPRPNFVYAVEYPTKRTRQAYLKSCREMKAREWKVVKSEYQPAQIICRKKFGGNNA